MNRSDQIILDRLCRSIESRKYDPSVIGEAYAHLKDTRGEAAAGWAMAIDRMYRARRKFEMSEVRAQLEKVFESPQAPATAEHWKRRFGAWGVIAFAALLLLLMTLSVFGIEPRGVGLAALAMSVGLAAAAIFWIDDGTAELTGRLFKASDVTGKYRLVGASAVFIVASALTWPTLALGRYFLTPEKVPQQDVSHPPQDDSILRLPDETSSQ